MRFLISTLFTSAAVATLAACSGNMAPTPSTAYAQPALPLNSAIKVRPDAVNVPHITTWSGNCTVTYAEVNGVWRYYYSPYGCDPAEGVEGYQGGTFDDTNHDWLVGEHSASQNSVLVLNQKGTQVGALTGLIGDPVGIATDSKGDVWVTNYPTNTISEFDAGATVPTATYTDGNMSSVRYVTLDKNGNIYLSGQAAGSGSLEVDELQGSAFLRIKSITGAVGAGIAVAPKSKTLWVCDEGNGTSGTIAGYTLEGFKRREAFSYSGDDTGIAVAPSEKEIYAIDNAANGSQFNVNAVIYDAPTGKVINSTPAITASTKVLGISNRR
jgi:DNA-binding beta-propeller fold protein YncE